MQKIKVFVDAHVFDGIYQGTTSYIKGLYNSLVKDDTFEITLAANDLERLKEHFDDRFNFIQLPNKSKIRRLAIDIPFILKKHNFDFAHFQYITPFIKPCKFINTIHDLLFLDYPSLFPASYRLSKRFTFGASALKSDIICTVSEYSKLALEQHFKINQDKIYITPNAVNISEFQSINLKETYDLEKYILFVSRFEPRKNHLGLLKAFVELKLYEQNYKLVLVGRMNDVKNFAYLNYFSQLPEYIKQYVIHLENIPPNVLFNLYAQAALFVFPSLAEGFGIPPLEAAVYGSRVLCSNRTAMSDFNFFGKYLFDPVDEQTFKQKIVTVLNEKNYPLKDIQSQIKEKCNWDIIATNFGNYLKSL